MACSVCGQENPPEARFCGQCGAPLVPVVEPSSPPPGESPTPGAPVPPEVGVEYMGFWIRVVALLIDTMIVILLFFSLQFFIIFDLIFAGLVSLVVLGAPLIYYLLFTGLKEQTLGKMALGIKVVDDRGNVPGIRRAVLREIVGKLLLGLVPLLGLLWILTDNLWVVRDRRKQALHDKIGRTYVVRARRSR